MNDLDKYIKELEDLIDESWTFPIAKNKYIVDSEKLKGIIEKIKKSYPIEITRAREIINNKTALENQAKKESDELKEKAKNYAETIMQKARKTREDMLTDAEAQVQAKLDDQEILNIAQKKASAIIEKAKADASRMNDVAQKYVTTTLDETKRALDKALGIIEQLQAARNDKKN